MACSTCMLHGKWKKQWPTTSREHLVFKTSSVVLSQRNVAILLFFTFDFQKHRKPFDSLRWSCFVLVTTTIQIASWWMMSCWPSPTMWRQCCRSPYSDYLPMQVYVYTNTYSMYIYIYTYIGTLIFSGIDSEISRNSQGKDGTVSDLQNCSMCPGRPNVTFFSSTSAKCQSSLNSMYPGCNASNASNIEEGKMERNWYGPSDIGASDMFSTFALYICVLWCVLYGPGRRSSFSCSSWWAQVVANAITFALFFHCCSSTVAVVARPRNCMIHALWCSFSKAECLDMIRFVCYFKRSAQAEYYIAIAADTLFWLWIRQADTCSSSWDSENLNWLELLWSLPNMLLFLVYRYFALCDK